MRAGWRFLLAVAGVLAAVILFVVLRSGDDQTTTPAPPPSEVTLSVGHPPPVPARAPVEILVPTNTDAIRRATIPRGRQVVLIVSGPPGEEVHLHGYDIRRNIAANGTARLPFRATIPGRFEVELEKSHRQVADLTVR